MGDRTDVRITVAKVDLAKVTEAFGFEGEIIENTDDIINILFDEMNYGGGEELDKLAELGVVFTGYHGAGCDYGESMFFCDGDRVQYLSCDNYGDPYITFNWQTGRLETDGLKRARQFRKGYFKAEEAVRKRSEDCI